MEHSIFADFSQFLDFWQHFYERTERIVFCVGPFCVYYYALCYVAALLLALWLGTRYARYFGVCASECDRFFVYVELGIILGARLGYVFIYSGEAGFYATHPWAIFDPFDAAGNFVGIAGMSYHGACVGAVISAYLFARKCAKNGAASAAGAAGASALATPKSPPQLAANRASMWFWLDLLALAAPLAYTLGRVGNFLNHELFGRESTAAWGVYVGETLRHPSQLYEAFFEGFCVWVGMMIYLKFKLRRNNLSAQNAAVSAVLARNGAASGAASSALSAAAKKAKNAAKIQPSKCAKAPKNGDFILLYAALYSLARFVCEFWREPDSQLGFVAAWLSMGQLLSLLMFAACAVIFVCRMEKSC